MRNKLWCVGVALLVVQGSAAAQLPDLRKAARVAVAYGAKIYGANAFLAGREPAAVRAEEFAPDTALDRMLGPLLKVEIDRDRGLVTARALDAVAVGVHRAGLGITIAPEGDPERLWAQTRGLPPLARERRERPWPLGDAEAKGSLPAEAAARLDAAVARAFEEPAEGPKIRTRAVIVVWKGRIVHERYAPGFGPDSALLGWSMAKSVTNALTGIAVRDGLLSLDTQPAVKLWSGEGDARGSITIRQLLGMAPGLLWNEDYEDLEADPAQMLFLAEAAGVFASHRPLIDPPGSRFVYSSGTTNILCQALRERFDSVAEHLAWPRRELFEPAGLDSMVLEPDPSGSFIGSSFAWATARDWARFGLLYLNDGVVAGRRILPEGWVQSSMRPVTGDARYGLHFWINAPRAGEERGSRWRKLPTDAFQASGYQVQKVTVVPSREAVIVRLGLTKVRQAFDEPRFLESVLEALP